MSTLSLTAPIGRLVAERPRRARVLDNYGIDYPCGGAQPLEAACIAGGLDPERVLDELARLDAEPPDEQEIDWSQATLKALTSHLRDAHHAYMRRALPRLAEHVDDAFGAHAPDHPALLELRGVFHAFRIDVEIHMGKEEELFFPLVLRLDQYSDAEAAERQAMPMRVLERDHEREAAQLLGQTTSTFPCQWRSTASETLPIIKRPIAPRPCEPSTMMSGVIEAAASRISSAGRPLATIGAAVTPRSASQATARATVSSVSCSIRSNSSVAAPEPTSKPGMPAARSATAMTSTCASRKGSRRNASSRA